MVGGTEYLSLLLCVVSSHHFQCRVPGVRVSVRLWIRILKSSEGMGFSTGSVVIPSRPLLTFVTHRVCNTSFSRDLFGFLLSPPFRSCGLPYNRRLRTSYHLRWIQNRSICVLECRFRMNGAKEIGSCFTDRQLFFNVSYNFLFSCQNSLFRS